MPTRRVILWVVLAVVLQLAVQIALPRIAHFGRQPTSVTSPLVNSGSAPIALLEDPALDGSPQDFVASVLSVKPKAVTGLKLLLPDRRAGWRRDTEWQWECEVGGRRVSVSTLGGGNWSLRFPREAERTSSQSVTLLQARAVATALVQRRLGGAFRGLEPSVAEELPRGDFHFELNQPTTSAKQGASVTVYIDPAGRIKSYAEHPGRSLIARPEACAVGPTEPEQDPRVFLASVLGLEAEQISAPKSTGRGIWKFVVNGREWNVTHRPWNWAVDDAFFGPRYQPGAALSVADARAAATTYVRRRWQGHLNVQGFLWYTDAGTRMYSYSWQERLAPWVMSGNSVAVIVYRDGALHHYIEGRIPPGLSENKVKISKAQARAAADKLVAWGANAEGRKYTFKSQSLTLWDDMANRPMWILRYTPSGTEKDWRKAPVRFWCIRVDGTTGVASRGQ